MNRRQGENEGKLSLYSRFRRGVTPVPGKPKAHRTQSRDGEEYFTFPGEKAMSSPHRLKSTLLFNPFPTLVPTIRNRGVSHPPIQKTKLLLPLCPHASGQFCLSPPASSSTCPGSRRPALSPRPSPGRPWAAPALSRAGERGGAGRRPPAGLAKLAAGQARGAVRQSGPRPCGAGAHWPASATWPPPPLY